MNQSEQLQRVQQIARALDAKFEIVGIRLGWDALLGLIPGIGDALASAISLYIVYTGYQLGASRAVLARMLLNILVESTIGAIPLFGDIFDIFWRANLRNVRLMQSLVERPRQTQATSMALITTIALLVALIIASIVALPIYILIQIFG
jgi:hypothetical protein